MESSSLAKDKKQSNRIVNYILTIIHPALNPLQVFGLSSNKGLLLTHVTLDATKRLRSIENSTTDEVFMTLLQVLAALSWTLTSGLAAAAPQDSATTETEATPCVAAAQKTHKDSAGIASLHFTQGMRACYDIIDLGHPVPGSVCIKRVETNYARDLAAAESALNQALFACQNPTL